MTPTTRPTMDELRAAQDWLDEQRCVVHPGPIETIRDVISAAMSRTTHAGEGMVEAAKELSAAAKFYGETQKYHRDDGKRVADSATRLYLAYTAVDEQVALSHAPSQPAPVCETEKLREPIALAIERADNQSIPDGYAIGIEHPEISDWVAFLADAVIAALRASPQPDRESEIARPLAEWHEDFGPQLWWKFPITEEPYVGSPLDKYWPGYHTHFTAIKIPHSLTEADNG